MKILFFFFGILMLCGCKSTPVPTGDRLVSVSWVNPTPTTLSFIETRICGSKDPVKLETLPAYLEVAVDTSRPLYKHCLVETRLMAGKEKITLLPAHLDSPARKSPRGEYNLRIQLRRDLPPVVTLEPIRLTRARLENHPPVR